MTIPKSKAKAKSESIVPPKKYKVTIGKIVVKVVNTIQLKFD